MYLSLESDSKLDIPAKSLAHPLQVAIENEKREKKPTVVVD